MSQAQALYDARFAQSSLYSRAFMDGYLDALQAAFGQPRTRKQALMTYPVRSAEYDAMRYGQTEGEADARDAKALEFFAPKRPPTSFNEGATPCC